MAKVAVGGDPRDPSKIKEYRPSPVNTEENIEWFMFLAVIFAMLAILFRVKFAAWCALYCVLSSFATLKHSEADYKQLFMSLMFSTMSLFMNYFAPQPIPRK
eukprot:GDKI01049730.1.p2 GENE.GDKI01049730.1~~GDKI01049730.1.p2  ORF type:complete len:102 (+),score=31.54 GDKI01049730.1:95-400(+)